MTDEKGPDGQMGDGSRAGDAPDSTSGKSEWSRNQVDYRADVTMPDGSVVTVGTRAEQDGSHEFTEMRRSVETPDEITTEEFRPWYKRIGLPSKREHSFNSGAFLKYWGKKGVFVGCAVGVMLAGVFTYRQVTSGGARGEPVQDTEENVEQQIDETAADVDDESLPGLDDDVSAGPDDGLPGLDDEASALPEPQEDPVAEAVGADDVTIDDVSDCVAGDPCSLADLCVDTDGCDAVGDSQSSSGLSPIGNVHGEAADLDQINYTLLDPTTHMFMGHVVGDGEGVANSARLFQISVRVDGAVLPWPEAGWDASVGYSNGEVGPGTVFSRSLVDGELVTTRLAGSSAVIEWSGHSDFTITVSGIDEGLPVERITISVSSAFSDEASCTNGCPLVP